MASFRRLSCALIPLSALLVSAAKADDSIRSITEELVLGVLNVDDPGGGSPADDRLRDLAEERVRALVDNARSQTDAVLGVAIPDSIASLIDTPLLEYIEKYSELEGHLTTTLLEYDDLSRAYQIALQPADASDTVFLHFDRPPPSLPLGHLVRVRGLLLPRVDDETGGSVRHMVLRSDDDALEVLSGADVITAPPPVGGQRTGAFVVNFSGEPAFLEDFTYDKEWRQLSDLVRRHSMGAAWLSVERVDHVELATAPTCDARSILQHLGQALAQSDRDLAEYDRVFTILPTMECGWRTQTTFPGSPTVVLVGGEPNTKLLLRALLHSFGMPGDHAHSCEFDTIHSECQEGTGPEPEYLRGVNAISISPFHKERVGWMSADDTNGIRTVRGDGSYRIFASDYINRNRWLALKFERLAPLLQQKTTYYIEYRTRKLVGGERLEPEVVVYIVNGSHATDVVNLTSPDPVSVELQDTIAVSVGRFVDEAAGLEIEVVNAYPWAVDLDISFDPTSCIGAASALEVAPRETPYLLAESTIRFSLAITSHDSENCGPSRQNLHLRIPDGWSAQQNSEAPLLQPGETAQMEVLVTIPPGEQPGFHDLEWIVQGRALIEAHTQTMLFLLPSTGGTQESDEIPAPTRTVNVSSSSQLSSALSSAQPGDHIVLANGSYSGFTLSRSGQQGRPIVVRAASTLGAKISGGINIRSNDAWVIGMDMTGGVNIEGTRDRISSSRIRAHGTSVHVAESARSVIVDHNEIISQANGTEVGWFGIALKHQDGGSEFNHHVYRNYLHDAPQKQNGGDDISAIYINPCSCRRVENTGNVIEYNLIENWYGDDEVIGTKSGGNIIRFNTLIGGKEFVNRLGGNNSWIANWLEGSGVKRLRIHDKDNTVIGNEAPEIAIYAGDGDTFGGDVSYVTPVDTVVAGNVGRLVVGKELSSGPNHPARNTSVEAHDGSIILGKHLGTTVSNETNRPIPQAVRLDASHVGPFAPTAPKM